MVEFRKLKYLFILMIIICLFSSCKDNNKLASQIAGCWWFSYSETYDDGTRQLITQYLDLHYEDNTNGGTFLEVIVSSYPYETDDDVYLDMPYCTTINGIWEYVDGSLCQHYDLSSLTVNVKEDKIKIIEDSYSSSVAAMYTTMFGDFARLAYKEYAKDFKKAMYKLLFHSYNDDNGACYNNVEIVDSELYFDAIDLGRTKCSKLADGTQIPGTEFLQ